MTVPAVRWLAAGCAEALESIHNVGLVHRDLKPANVLMSPDGPRVIDFGVARAAERIQLTATSEGVQVSPGAAELVGLVRAASPWVICEDAGQAQATCTDRLARPIQ
jgi:serine/threonine protein kinase